MDFRGGGGGGKKRPNSSSSGGGGGSQQKSGGGGGGSSRYNVTPLQNPLAGVSQDQMNQLIMQQYFLQQQQEEHGNRGGGGGGAGGGNIAAAHAAAAALFGGLLGDKLGGGGGGGGGASAREQQQIQELLAAAAAAQQQQQQSSSLHSQLGGGGGNSSSARSSSNTPSPSPRISSPHTSRNSNNNNNNNNSPNAAAAAALQQITAAAAAAAALQSSGSKKDAGNAAAAALAAQQQLMYLDYLQRVQQDAQAQVLQQVQAQQQQQHHGSNKGGRGRSNSNANRQNASIQQQLAAAAAAQHHVHQSLGGSSHHHQGGGQSRRGKGGGGDKGGGGRNSAASAAAAAAAAAASSELSRLFEHYPSQSSQNANSLLKSSVLASAKLPADTEIIVQKNTRGSGVGGGNSSSSLLQQLKQQVQQQQQQQQQHHGPVPGKRGPKPKNLQQQQLQQAQQSHLQQQLHHHASTITSAEQAKFEQQLINLGNNNAITITPANLDMKGGSGSDRVSGGSNLHHHTSGASSSSHHQAPITITPTVSIQERTPPAAHSTPFRYGNDNRREVGGSPVPPKPDEFKDIQPAHKYVKELYTHVIPRKPQIGLIGPSNTRSSKQGAGAGNKGGKSSLQSSQQSHHQTQQFRHHRPWIIEPNSGGNNDVIITPSNTGTPPPLNLNKDMMKDSKKLFNLSIPNNKPAPEPIIISPPDYSVPIKDGWKREMILKSFDLNEENLSLACEVTYISPEGKVFSSLNEVKKASIPDPKNFTFNSKIQLGRFVLPASEQNTRRFEYEDLVDYFNDRKVIEAIRKRNLRMKQEHNNYVKLIEAYRKNKRKLKLSEKKKIEEVVVKTNEIEELIDDLDNNVPVLAPVHGKKLNDKTFANLLQIHEFLHTFGETLGFDTESLPSLTSLQKAFLHVEDNEEELVSVLCHLLVCAVEDPGLPNPTGTKHLTPFGQTLKQADVTFGSMSEILRIYLNGISDSEPEAEEYAEWLENAPFTAQSAFRKSTIVAFICDVLLQNKAVLKFLDNCSELIHNCKKEKQQNEIRVRKLRMLVARKQVAASIEEENAGGASAGGGGGGTTTGGGNDGSATPTNNQGTEKGPGDKTDERADRAAGERETELVSAGEDSMMQGDEEKPPTKDPAYAAVASVADSISSDPDSKLTIEELNSKMNSLATANEKLKKQMQNNSKAIRSVSLGQDRWRRRYWNLHYSGGVYVEGGATGEFESVRDAVKEKFEKDPPPPPDPQMEVEDTKPVVVPEPPPPVVVEVKQEEKENNPDLSNAAPDPSTPGADVKEETLNGNNNNNNNCKEGVPAGAPHPPTTPEVKRSTPFTVAPPVIKIFSFAPRLACSGSVPEAEDQNVKATDDELLIKHIQGKYWYDWKSLAKQEDVDGLSLKLCDKGIREKNLKNSLASCNFRKIPDLRASELDGFVENPEDDGFVDPELLYKIHLGLIETLETLEERVASASLQVKGWVLPNRNLIQENLTEEQIIEIVKERVLDLENAVERRYLKPPLGKSGLEVNLTQLLKETEDVSYNLLMDGPIGSTSSTRGQQINENNKLKMELKERERIEKELAARKEKEEGGGGKGESRFLNHWRDSIGKTTSPSVLSMAIYILDSCIAWDKSVMKASCQLCKGGDNEDKLLLCDACDRGYHTYCFKPPLENIPDGDWFCWECINKATGNKCCIVCGKGQVPNVKLLCCDKCVKAYHQDCIIPPVTKAPRGRWFCPDHSAVDGKGKVTLSQAVSVSMNVSGNGGSGSGGGLTGERDRGSGAGGGDRSSCGSGGGGVVNNAPPPGNVTPISKKGSPKKKGGGRASDRSSNNLQQGQQDGNVSDSSNSSSFVAGNTTPAASQESDGGGDISSGGGGGGGGRGSSGRASTPVSSKKESSKKKSKKGSSSSKKQKEKEKVEEMAMEQDDCGSGGDLDAGGSSSAPSPEKPQKMSKKQKQEMGWCDKILDDLVVHEDAWPFLEPVNTRQFPTYKKIIKTPMDLQTIRTRLVSHHYKNKDGFLDDVRLIFDNCETFNEDDSPVGKAGFTLRTFFEAKPGVGVGGNSSSGGGNGSGGGGK